MAQRSRLLELMQGQAAPPGASAGAVGTDVVPTAELGEGAPPPAPAAEAPPEGEEQSQNAIMQAMASGEKPMTPEEEEFIKARLALAARQQLLGGV